MSCGSFSDDVERPLRTAGGTRRRIWRLARPQSSPRRNPACALVVGHALGRGWWRTTGNSRAGRPGAPFIGHRPVPRGQTHPRPAAHMPRPDATKVHVPISWTVRSSSRSTSPVWDGPRDRGNPLRCRRTVPEQARRRLPRPSGLTPGHPVPVSSLPTGTRAENDKDKPSCSEIIAHGYKGEPMMSGPISHRTLHVGNTGCHVLRHLAVIGTVLIALITGGQAAYADTTTPTTDAGAVCSSVVNTGSFSPGCLPPNLLTFSGLYAATRGPGRLAPKPRGRRPSPIPSRTTASPAPTPMQC